MSGQCLDTRGVWDESSWTRDVATLDGLLDCCALVLSRHGSDPHRPLIRLLQVPRCAALQSALRRDWFCRARG